MPPKQSTLSIILAIILTITFSSAHDCSDYDSVSDLIRYYDLPPGLFPNAVKRFSCDPVNRNAHKLSLKLDGVCRVSRSLLGIGNVVEWEPEISAVISYRELTKIKGVTVTLTFNGKPVGEVMTVTEAKVVRAFWGKFLVLNSGKGSASPWFPVALIPNEPPSCDSGGFEYFGNTIFRLVA